MMLLTAVPMVWAQTTPPRITINGISVRDITQKPIAKTEDGSLLIADQPGFQIVYFPKFDNEFLIDINNAPFDQIRPRAERYLLDQLEISKKEACFLYIVVSTASQINPSEGGKNYALSFCEQKARADINNDGIINTIDYALVIKNYRQTATVDGREDVNRDGSVNAGDLSVILELLGEKAK